MNKNYIRGALVILSCGILYLPVYLIYTFIDPASVAVRVNSNTTLLGILLYATTGFTIFYCIYAALCNILLFFSINKNGIKFLAATIMTFLLSWLAVSMYNMPDLVYHLSNPVHWRVLLCFTLMSILFPVLGDFYKKKLREEV